MEGPYATIATATALSKFTPYEMRGLLLDRPVLVRSVVIAGRRLVVLTDVLELSAIATPLSFYFDDQEGNDDAW
jgi:hypothetical protein